MSRSKKRLVKVYLIKHHAYPVNPVGLYLYRSIKADLNHRVPIHLKPVYFYRLLYFYRSIVVYINHRVPIHLEQFTFIDYCIFTDLL